MKKVLFKLKLKGKLVGYESWDELFHWSYSYPKLLGARAWHGNYIPHDEKILIKEINNKKDNNYRS